MDSLLNVILAPMGYEFMQRGMLAAVIVGVLCSVIGCYVVLRGMAFLGDALAHAILPGIALAYLWRGDLLLGALAAGVVVALAIGLFSRHEHIREDTAIGIVFAAALALGVALMSTIKTYSVDLAHVLFGNVLGVSPRDLWLTGGIAMAALATVVLLYKELLVVSFDPILAATMRLPVNALRNLLLVLLALTVVVSLQTIGVGLVTAMLVTPAATAYLLTRRLFPMMLVAAAVGAGSTLLGLYLSFYVNIASGATMVLACTGCFVLAYLFAPARGIVWMRLADRRVRAGV